MQLQAGFITDSVRDYLTSSGFKPEEVDELLYSLSFFEIEYDSDILTGVCEHKTFAVAENIITRGLPTLLSIYCEEVFSKVYGRTRRDVDDTGRISYPYNPDGNFAHKLYQSLHIIDPRIKNDRNNYQTKTKQLGSPAEESFLFEYVPLRLGCHFLQLLDTQRKLDIVLSYARHYQTDFDIYKQKETPQFPGQRLDFSIEFPYPVNNISGIVIEIDGPQHDKPAQRNLDQARDRVVGNAGWGETIRIPTKNLNEADNYLQPLRPLLDSGYFHTLRQNYEEPLYNDTEGLDAMEVALSPFAAARIEKTILHLINNDILSLDQPDWKIAVVERDVSCGRLAFEDLKRLLDTLLKISGEAIKLPEIILNVIPSPEFHGSKLKDYFEKPDIPIERYDLIIDISMLQRMGIDTKPPELPSNIYIRIRSSHGIQSDRRFLTSSRISYLPIIEDIGECEEYVESLKTLLQNIFRKKTFRPGQIEIINRVLQLKNTVGLLPTGSGKSLTYQLSALLQPGITLIVDPLKSLMKDQFDGLIRQRIDAATFINSSVPTPQERKYRTGRMKKGEVLFAFVSPERLQIEEFRHALHDMSEKHNTFFSYCVIDEVHCVSEWGHDFRTAYLRLGENARRYCNVKPTDIQDTVTPEKVTLIGLTATASFDVLADVQRELQLLESDIVRMESADRPELCYMVHEVPLGPGLDNQNLGLIKQQELNNLISNIPQEIEYQNGLLESKDKSSCVLKNFTPQDFFQTEEIRHTGIVFCPHKTWTHGVDNVAAAIHDGGVLNVGTFYGGNDNSSAVNQDRFIGNELNILVCTKAFGMGIDKPNVRFSIHFNYPNSIESYYQEAGRCGRDGKLALSYILFGNYHANGAMQEHPFQRQIHLSFHNSSFRGEDKEKHIIHEFLSTITYPKGSNVKFLNGFLINKYSFEGYCTLWNGQRLYVNNAQGISYGYFDLNQGFTSHPDTLTFPLMVSNQMLNQVKDALSNIVPYGTPWAEWLKITSIQGIESQLKGLQVSEELAPITVGFTGNAVETVVSILHRHGIAGAQESQIWKSYDYAFTPEDFMGSLILNLGLNALNDRPLRRAIERLYWKIRDEKDTFKAIYRLSILGVIEDYIIDYNSKTITLYGIKRRDDGEYIESLYRYVLRYFSKEKAELVRREVHDYRGQTTLQKCLGYLIHFIYEEIAKKRLEAIDSMNQACIKGLQGGPEEFREYLNLYFNSKYYGELKVKTDSGKEYCMDYVWDFITKTQGNINNLKHLRGACVRLLTENPDNGAFHLLKAFSTLLIEPPGSRLIDDAKQSFHKGFQLFHGTDRYDMKDLMPIVIEYCSRLSAYNNSLRSVICIEADIFFLQHHIKWLKEFNNKFMSIR